MRTGESIELDRVTLRFGAFTAVREVDLGSDAIFADVDSATVCYNKCRFGR